MNRGAIPALGGNEIQKKSGIEEKTQVSVIVDQDRTLNYEIRSWITRILRVPVVLILNLLPKQLGRTLFLLAGSATKAVYDQAATYRALEILYTYPERRKKGELSLADRLWGEFLDNSLAVRNRLKLVKNELKKIIKNLENDKKRLRLMSLGSGSARAIIETLAELKGLSVPIDITLVDTNLEALDYSKNLASEYGITNKIEYHCDSIQNLEKYCVCPPDIVEMIGILEYCPDETAVDLIRKIFQVLAPRGYLITGNIAPNIEARFVTKAINWPMIYRTPSELGSLLIESGFSPEGLKIKREPLLIHSVVIAEKF